MKNKKGRGKGFKYFEKFTPRIDEGNHELHEYYKEILDCSARLTNECLYIADFYEGCIPYLSYNPLFLCGVELDSIRKGHDFSFNEKYASPEDIKMMIEVTVDWMKFLEKTDIAERKNYILRFDYMLNNKLIELSLTPILLDKYGKVWQTLCRAKLSLNSESGNAVIFKQNEQVYWKYSSSKRWIKKSHLILSDTERKILLLSLQGMKEYEICDLQSRSINSLKSIKRKLFYRMEVNNITEAVSKAISFGLI